jgi:hypothetical protein
MVRAPVSKRPRGERIKGGELDSVGLGEPRVEVEVEQPPSDQRACIHGQLREQPAKRSHRVATSKCRVVAIVGHVEQVRGYCIGDPADRPGG